MRGAHETPRSTRATVQRCNAVAMHRCISVARAARAMCCVGATCVVVRNVEMVMRVGALQLRHVDV